MGIQQNRVLTVYHTTPESKMNETNRFKLWARRSGFWSLDQIASLSVCKDGYWDSSSESLTLAAEAWHEANLEEHNGDYTDFLIKHYIDDIDDEWAEFEVGPDDEREYADPRFHAGWLAWEANYSG